MKTKEILIEIINKLEEFEAESSSMGFEPTTADFISFMSLQHNTRGLKVESIDGGNFDWNESNPDRNPSVTDISILVTLMFRYAKMYIKKALKDSTIRTIDEFSFLITLLTHESLTKQEAINLQVMEKTSGIEILNRLIKMGFIEQYQDKLDKRSTRIKITNTGKYTLLAIMPQMQLVSEIVVGNLNESERSQLAFLLRKLDNYHNDIYINRKEEDLINFRYEPSEKDSKTQKR